MLTEEKTWRQAAHVVLGLVGVIILLTFRHYGVSWDEEIQNQYGQAVFDYYHSFFVDHRYREIFNLYLYGGMFDGLAGFLNAYTPFHIYDTRHLLNAFLGLLGLWGTWRLGRFLGSGGQVGFTALVLLALTPMYYGHMFNNPKDIPFAAGVVWSIYYMMKSLKAFPRAPLSLILKLGIVLGLTLGVRVGGVMLLGYWGLVLTIHAITKKGLSRATLFPIIVALAKQVVPVTVIAYIIMLICWPWAQEAPFANPAKAFVEFSNFPQAVEVLLHGKIYMSTELPWYYVPVYFMAQLPLPQLILMFLGVGFIPLFWRSLRRDVGQSALLLIVLAILVPVLYAVLGHPALYDAVRHFLFIVPLLCLLAALAVAELVKLCARYTTKRIAIALLIVFLTVTAAVEGRAMVQLHPYEYIFVNSLEGGVKGAYDRFELDYWSSSFKEAAEKLQAYVAKKGGVPPGKIYRVAICGPWSSATIYLPPDYAPVIANEPAEFFLSTTRWMCQDMRPGTEIIRVERMGAPLSIIKELSAEDNAYQQKDAP